MKINPRHPLADWLAMAAALRRSWRTWLFTLITYIGRDRLISLGQSTVGRPILRLLRAVLAGGSIHVRGGAGFGLRLSTDHLPMDHVQGYGLVRGTLEPEVQEALRRHVGPGAVVFDIGANLGFFSLLSASLAGPTGRIEAFEPVPSSAAAVRANASLNSFSNVRVHDVAVADKPGEARLWVPVDASWAHLDLHGRHPNTDFEVVVSVVSIDREIAAGHLPVPHVVKIDVEGAEVGVLRGMRETLAAHELVVICELHESNREVLSLANELGYAVTNLQGTVAVDEAGPIHVLITRPAELSAHPPAGAMLRRLA
jgi:FkbM family methyltransferase